MGTFAVGSVFDIRMVTQCLWEPGTAVAVTVNGQFVATKTADAGSGVNVNVTVLSTTQLSIDDPVLVPARCGRNEAVGSGPSASAGGATETFTATFNVECDAAAAGAPRRAGVAFTGDNLLRWGGIALALTAGGWLLVTVARRRRTTPDA